MSFLGCCSKVYGIVFSNFQCYYFWKSISTLNLIGEDWFLNLIILEKMNNLICHFLKILIGLILSFITFLILIELVF